MVKFIYNDAGSDNEPKDCTVRAISISTNKPYKDAYNLLFQAGRKPGKPFNITKFLKVNSCYLDSIFQKLPFRKPKTINKFLKEYNKGTYLAKVTKHVFVVKDGAVYDMFKPSPYQRIIRAWKVTDVRQFNID